MRNRVSLFRSRAVFVAPILLALALCFSACHSRKTTVVASPGYSTTQKPSQIAKQAVATVPDATKRLMSEADKWLGTPYSYGGHTRGKGADCSGFVTQVFLDALSIKLPRNSSQQQQWCSILGGGRRELIPGDLVFFTTGKKGSGVNHVGLYVGNGKMIHSSTSRGVIVSDLDEKYYADTYHSAGRVEPYYAMVGNRQPAAPEPTQSATQPEPEKPLIAEVAPELKKAPDPSPALQTTFEEKKQYETSPAVRLKAVKESADTALTPAEARRLLLNRLRTDSIN